MCRYGCMFCPNGRTRRRTPRYRRARRCATRASSSQRRSIPLRQSNRRWRFRMRRLRHRGAVTAPHRAPRMVSRDAWAGAHTEMVARHEERACLVRLILCKSARAARLSMIVAASHCDALAASLEFPLRAGRQRTASARQRGPRPLLLDSMLAFPRPATRSSLPLTLGHRLQPTARPASPSECVPGGKSTSLTPAPAVPPLNTRAQASFPSTMDRTCRGRRE